MSYLFADVGGNVYEAKRNKIEHEAGSFSAVEPHFISFDFNCAKSKPKGRLTIYIPNTFTDKTRDPVIISGKNK